MKFHECLDRAAKIKGITSINALRCLIELGQLTIARPAYIASRLELRIETVCGAIKALEKAGFAAVEKISAQHTEVTITAEGEEEVRRLFKS
jgi:DNA-binding MarR family transcriptional regulator